MTDQEAQDDELLALSSIYDNVLKVTKENGLFSGELMAWATLPEDFCVKIGKHKNGTEKEKCQSIEIHKIKYMPPVLLNFMLPQDYPSLSPPQFTLSCKWLNRQQLTDLCKKLDLIWEENQGSVILFQWNTFLQDNVCNYLNLTSPLELAQVLNTTQVSLLKLDPRAIQEINSYDQLFPVISEYNRQEKIREFERSVFTCNVCFCTKSGLQCTMFYNCEHIFCNDCMRDYFSVQIKDGNVQGLECPEDKCESQAHPAQVKALVSPDLFIKYEQLLFQSSLDTMADVVFCPRTVCQTPVLIDKDTTLACCPECTLAFCTLCKLVYHGLSPCRLKLDNLLKLRQEYLSADPANKRLLEKQYGKVLIKQALEESYSHEWLTQHSKQCPKCGTHIQKTDGCNKMTCIKCRTYFCWLCNSHLSRANPYSHYNSESPCFNRLFEGAEIEDEWEDDFTEEEEEDGAFFYNLY